MCRRQGVVNTSKQRVEKGHPWVAASLIANKGLHGPLRTAHDALAGPTSASLLPQNAAHQDALRPRLWTGCWKALIYSTAAQTIHKALPTYTVPVLETGSTSTVQLDPVGQYWTVQQLQY
jgi:hypothetical protein